MRNKKGFTLVELVIVIAVIAILATVLLPTFAGILERTRENARVQKATSARDEFFSEGNFSTINELKGYVIKVDESYYIVGNNGMLSNFEKNEDFENYYSSIDTTSQNLATIYEPTQNVAPSPEEPVEPEEIDDGVSGVYDALGNRVQSWNELVSNELITVSGNELVDVKDVEGASEFVIKEGIEVLYNSSFYNTNYTSIVLPNSLTTISSYTFGSCKKLTKVTILEGSNLEVIDTYAFDKCSSLSSINLVDATKLTTIRNKAFTGCSALKNLELPQSIVLFHFNAFDSAFYNSNIYVTTSNNVKYYKVGNNAYYIALKASAGYTINSNTKVIAGYFSYGVNKITTLTISDNIIAIGEEAFYFNSKLTSVKLSSNLEYLGEAAFASCSGLVTIDFNNCKLTSIASRALSTTTKLAYILNLPSITVVEDYAFYGCLVFKNFVIFENLEYIGKSAFAQSGITSVNITKDVTYIGASAFSGCSSLATITVDSLNPNYTSLNSNCIIEKATDTLLAVSNSTVIPSSVKIIGESAFGSSKLTTITLPEGIEKISENAFNLCQKLVSITLPSTLIEICDSAFNGCMSLTSIEIPNGVKTIGYNAFSDCTKLTSITISDSVESIGMGALACYGSYLSNDVEIDIYFNFTTEKERTIEDFLNINEIEMLFEMGGMFEDEPTYKLTINFHYTMLTSELNNYINQIESYGFDSTQFELKLNP